MPTNEEIKTTLLKAADHIEQYGLNQNGRGFAVPYPKEEDYSSWKDPNKPWATSAACMIAAIEFYTPNARVFGDALDQVRETLGIPFISLWSDDSATTKEMAVDALRRAASVN